MQAIWQQRLERARELAKLSPVEPDVLDFYRHIAGFQASLAEGARPANLHLLEGLADRAGDDPLHAFFRRVLRAVDRSPGSTAPEGRCPRCAELPVAVVFREDCRRLLCGVCFHQWEHAGTACLACGGETLKIVPDETAQELPHIAIETCRACRTYLKAIGDGGAVPEVDELASVIVDLWATAQGFTKLQTNLFGM
ncbi:MAG: formate dehydrogenase accessory protein FdhE [Candidatus Solibacter sp.]